MAGMASASVARINLHRLIGKPGEYSVQPFPLYTLRHTCLTRWAPHMDPWTLAHLAGHRDMAITKRYVHPQAETIRVAMEKARSSAVLLQSPPQETATPNA
jgi:integrase